MADQHDGEKTFTTASDLSLGQLVKLSSGGVTVEATNVGDVAIGVVQKPRSAGQGVTVRLLDSGRTHKVLAGEAILRGATVFAGSNGRLTATDPAVDNNARYIALDAASASGSVIEIVPTTDGGIVNNTPVFVWNQVGPFGLGVFDAPRPMPADGNIVAVTMFRGTAGGTGSTIVTLIKNRGTPGELDLYGTNPGDRPEITAASGDTQIVLAVLPDIVSVLAQDPLEARVDQDEGGSPNADLVLLTRIQF